MYLHRIFTYTGRVNMASSSLRGLLHLNKKILLQNIIQSRTLVTRETGAILEQPQTRGTLHKLV